MSDLHDNDDLLNFDIIDGDFADGQLNEDELLLSDEDELLDEKPTKSNTNNVTLEDSLLEESAVTENQNVGTGHKDTAQKKEKIESDKPQDTRKRLKRRNPAIITPEPKVISKKSNCDANASQTIDASKKPDDEVVQVKKIKIPEKTEEFIKSQVKKNVEINKIQEVKKSPESKKILDPKNILEVRKILESTNESKKITQDSKSSVEPEKSMSPQKVPVGSPKPLEERKITRIQRPNIVPKEPATNNANSVISNQEPAVQPQEPVEIPPVTDKKEPEPEPEITTKVEPEVTVSDSIVETSAPATESNEIKDTPKQSSACEKNTKLIEERLENLENADEELPEKPLNRSVSENFAEDSDILELDTASDLPGQADNEASSAGTDGARDDDKSDKRSNKFDKKFHRSGKMGLGYNPHGNYQNQTRPPLDPQWIPGPGQNYPIGPTFPPGGQHGAPMIRPPMGQNPPMHLMGARMPGPPHGPMPGGPQGMPRHPMGPRIPMQGPPHMMGNFPPGPRGPGPFFNNYMGQPGPRPNGPPNIRQRFFYQNQNQMPNMRPQMGPNPASKSPTSPMKHSNPQNPNEAGVPPEYVPTPIIQPFHEMGPGIPPAGQTGRKVLINPNFKGGVEAAKSQLIKDQFGLPYMSGPPLSDDELLRQQQEFINKNLRCVEKRRHERSPSPDYRRYSNSPSPPPYRNSYRGGRGGGDRRYYNRNNRGSPKYRNYDSNSGSKGKDDNDVEEDEETRAYRLQIENQKQKREEMLRQKEMRRRQAAEQKAKEVQEKEETARLQPIVVTEKKIILTKKPKLEDEKPQQENTEVIVKTSAKTNKILVKKIVNELNEKSSTPPPPIPLQTHSQPSESSTPPLPSLSTSRRIVLKPSSSLKQKSSVAGLASVHDRLDNLSSKKVIADVNKRKIQNIIKNNTAVE